MSSASSRHENLNQQIISCTKCPRLINWCRQVATEKRKSFQDWDYWGKPAPNFGDPDARIVIIGLAPAAHGANRTGRVFTGDESGNWLFRALYENGLANQAESYSRDDGLTLKGVMITAACHCAPPANKPTTEELENCLPFFQQTLDLLSDWKVIVALGRIGYIQALKSLSAVGYNTKGLAGRFAHAAVIELEKNNHIVCSYHPSQQNTFTGKLTRPMLNEVFRIAKELAEDFKP